VIERILKEAADEVGGDRPAADIEPEDITPLLAKIYRRGAEAYVNSFRAYLSAAFTFGLKAEYDFTRQGSENGWGLKTNPVTAIPINRGGVRAGNRFLTPAELRSFWLWLDISIAPFRCRGRQSRCWKLSSQIVTDFTSPIGASRTYRRPTGQCGMS
jgi:hypothetical protein